jgi:hypothetical protein
MPKLFRSRHSTVKPLQDAYSSLLDPDAPQPQSQLPTRRSRGYSLAGDLSTRAWFAAAEGRPSWSGDRPPTRKLVKDMNGSGRPSFSLELSDNSDAEKEKGLVRRHIARLKELYLYRKEK